ncbi:hypothetical protein [Methylobacterium sp. J-076]|uniref:hypothetical protein n=1 Tax=Methylobacterium sp. J-076 TaxID=2836655 RepID=UPI001FB8E58B|nr:hypothetical protein [Methylobacterium sp. J-076]MCJ2013741.1 hypothetical protein [Methylobacterium sp. J-076]
MAFFIGIACPWILVILLDRISEQRRAAELSSLGISPVAVSRPSAYLTKPDRPY